MDTDVSIPWRLKLRLEMEGAWGPPSIRASACSFSSQDTCESPATWLGHRVPPRHHLNLASERG